MTQEALEQAVKLKITNGYLSIDNKNVFIWASTTALLLSTAMISYEIGYAHAHNHSKNNLQMLQSYSSMESVIIENYEKELNANKINESVNQYPVNRYPFKKISYYDKNGSVVPIN